MKIAVLGGSFNPIHIGHLALADEVCTSLGYDRVLFIPTYNPPHKEMNGALPASVRLELVRQACSFDSRFQAEPCEVERAGVSYTYDTICYLEKKYEKELESPIGLIMGDDLLPGFHLWHKAADIAEKCTLILARRKVSSENKEHANVHSGEYANVSHGEKDFDIAGEPLFKNAVRLDNAVLPVSSTDIRTRIAAGRSFRYLVPTAVFNYIKDGLLYGYK
ncbi:MAG: nicotinate (nicotinamide) nucleotide adenylyltransferase [Treponema sp.]|nr:nicotinate (nicotinamide) nucleotide adenylyltransferase [Treponema sp.]